jgi:uncharacterized protein YcgL (UPF0745 family)
MLCQVFRSPKRSEMYLYVERREGLARVPEALLSRFGEPAPVMLVNLDGSRKLARVDADRVVEQIREQGYFLQMPPGLDELRREKSG